MCSIHGFLICLMLATDHRFILIVFVVVKFTITNISNSLASRIRCPTTTFFEKTENHLHDDLLMLTRFIIQEAHSAPFVGHLDFDPIDVVCWSGGKKVYLILKGVLKNLIEPIRGEGGIKCFWCCLLHLTTSPPLQK